MQDLRELTRLSLARSLRGLPEQDRLALALTAVCGSAMAAHCSVSHLSEAGALTLKVDGPEWMDPLLGMRAILLHDLQRVAGVRLTELHFEVAGRSRTHRR